MSIGEGIKEIFQGLGVDYLIEGGQTMNPSTEDMLTAIEKVNAKNIFILPNNKNIILAANQAKAMTEDKNIIVVPTKTVPQGITAMISYVPEKSAEENEEAMTEGIQMVKTGQVTYAVRDTHIDEKEIHQGDIMGLGDHGLLAVGQDILTVAEETIRAMVDEDSELISIYYGEDMSEEDAESLGETVTEVMAGTGLQCFSVMHQCFDRVCVFCSGEFLVFCLSSCYEWDSHCLFIAILINFPHLDCSFFSFFICCMKCVTFLP